MAWTVDDLLSAVRREAFLPDAHDLSSSDLLAIADEECNGILADLWKTAREEYGVTYEDAALVAGQQRYRIPRRALARTVRGVSFVDAQGNESPAQELPPMEAWRYQRAPGATVQAAYFFEGDDIVLVGTPSSSSGSLRVRYYQRPPRMVAAADGARILTAATATTLVTIGGAPATITDAGSLVDIVRGDSPFPLIFRDRVVASWSSPTLTLTANTPVVTADISTSSTNGTRRDYVCARDTTVYPPLPQEMHPVLISCVVRRVLELSGDREALDAAESTLQRRHRAAVAVVEPRNADRKPAIIARGGPLRGRGRSRGWWR